MGNVLFFGDVVGSGGCQRLRERLHPLRRRYQADVVIVNGENSAEGNGVTPQSADMLFRAGVDVITGGNHSLRRPEIYDYLERQSRLLRPVNLHRDAPGGGVYVLDNPSLPLTVISLMGMAFMDGMARENPFDCMDRLLTTVTTPYVIVDFHGESTAEKQALGYYLDGRVSAVLGTHTHVPTADERILPGGTVYITDVGMCGGTESVIGVHPKEAIFKQRTGLPVRFRSDHHSIQLQGVALSLDKGKAVSIERFVD